MGIPTATRNTNIKPLTPSLANILVFPFFDRFKVCVIWKLKMINEERKEVCSNNGARLTKHPYAHIYRCTYMFICEVDIQEK